MTTSEDIKGTEHYGVRVHLTYSTSQHETSEHNIKRTLASKMPLVLEVEEIPAHQKSSVCVSQHEHTRYMKHGSMTPPEVQNSSVTDSKGIEVG